MTSTKSGVDQDAADWLLLECDRERHGQLWAQVCLRAPLYYRWNYWGTEAAAWLLEHERRGNSPRIPDDMLAEARTLPVVDLPLPPYPEWWPAFKEYGPAALNGRW